ncbi:MAG: 5'-nucleotidase C-terminal domain-containing protein [Deltaproteobacteria bacterium]|nr:5'-nucleotidase C-terminal domain-containing protein [Deltaproteobacteria bacterium]
MGNFTRLRWWSVLGGMAAAFGLTSCDGDDAGTPDADGGDADAEAGDGDANEADVEAGPTRRLTILHTNDVHSHLMGTGPELEYSPGTTGDDPTRGGVARLATLLAERRAAAEAAGNDVLVTDGGDSLMGTPFEILDADAAPALMMFQHLGYDLVTLGNHDFEWSPDYLARTIETANGLGFDVPIVLSNMVTSATDARDDRLAALVDDGTILPETTLTLGDGLVVGVLGWLGEAAASVVPEKEPLTFGEDAAALQTRAAALKAAGADLVVLLSHTGQQAGGGGRDQAIAAAAPDIDVILGGHGHDALTEPLVSGDTLIIQAGAHTEYLAELTVDVSDDGVSLVSYELLPVDDSIAGDAPTQALVDGWIDDLDAGFLAENGVTYDEPIAETTFDLVMPGMAEANLGDLITDAYREAAAAATASDPVVVAFESDGVIGDDLLAGDDGVLSFADVFRVLFVGTGPDSRPGFPLVSFWVDGAELRDACEVTVSVPGIAGGDYIIQTSGLRCHIDPGGGLMTLIDGVYLGNDVDGYSPTSLDISGADPTLHRIVVDYRVATMMSVLGEMTYGLLEITPKQADGTPVTDMASMILDTDPAITGVQELKLWEALLAELRSFPDDDGDGLPDVPARYAVPAGRYYE